MRHVCAHQGLRIFRPQGLRLGTERVAVLYNSWDIVWKVGVRTVFLSQLHDQHQWHSQG